MSPVEPNDVGVESAKSVEMRRQLRTRGHILPAVLTPRLPHGSDKICNKWNVDNLSLSLSLKAFSSTCKLLWPLGHEDRMYQTLKLSHNKQKGIVMRAEED